MKHTDFLIVGTGAAGLFCALQIPSDKQVLMITKEDRKSTRLNSSHSTSSRMPSSA